MRFAFFAAIFIFLSAGAMAQPRVALVLGGHKATVDEKNNLSDWDSVSNNYSGRTGLHAGFIADIPLSKKGSFYLQPGVIYYNKGRKYEGVVKDTLYIDPLTSTSELTTFIDERTQYIDYIDVPVNLVYKIKLNGKTKFMLGGGPQFSFYFSGKESSTQTMVGNGSTTNETSNLPVGKDAGKYKVVHYGVNAMAGFEFGRVFLTANYSKDLSDFYTSSSYNGTFRHQTIGATLGIFLGNQKTSTPKIKDKDGDGVPDAQDECPTVAGTALTKGCPDKDGDGIADKNDKCPDVAGVVKYKGCPAPDKDKDGVSDESDKCPDVAGVIRYNGCPVPDSDKDGINDEEDKCPQQAGVARYNGCPVPDTDKDGVNDEEDKCPTVAGFKENNGCPEIKKEVVEKVNKAAGKIQFQTGKSILLPASYKVLDQVVEILKADASLKLMIDGHSSKDGTEDFNMKLSQARADEVKNYFISKGIDASRIQATGYGSSKPLNEGRTAAERALNRRVEMQVSNY